MRKPTPLAVLSLTLVAGCSSEAVPVPGARGAEVQALYGPPEASALTPFPSNRYAVADGATLTGLRVDIGAHNTLDPIVLAYPATVAQLDALDGFSTTGGIIAGFSGPVDMHGLAPYPDADPPDTTPLRDAATYAEAGSPILLVDVDPASADRGRAIGLLPRYWAQPVNVDFAESDFTVVAQPAEPLRPATRYLFVVTSALRGEGGEALVRSPGTDALVDGDAEGAYGAEVREALDVLEAEVGVPRGEVRLASTFTTQSVVEELAGMAARARTQPAPALLEPFTVETPLGADGRVRFRAAFATPEYRRPRPDGKWLVEDGLPVPQAEVGLELFLAFADGTHSGPRPVVIYAHGLGGDKDGCWGTADRLKDIDAAVMAIDSPEHGSRSDGSGSEVASIFGFFGIDPQTQDFDIGRARDSFRQMGSDQLELVRFIGTLGDLDVLPPGAPDGVPDLDVSRILYIGHSFGSVQGPTVFALAPEITQAVWNVGGDGIMTLIRDSQTFSLLVEALAPPGTSMPALGRFFAATQAIVDRGDPLNFARYGTLEPLPGARGWKARDVLLQEVVDDSIVPNSATEALARAAGLTLADAARPVSGMAQASAPLQGNLQSGATGVLYQFARMNGDAPANHGELIFSDEARAQYVGFFSTGLSAAHATVSPVR
ncbi:MAG: hypothetical protein WKG00_39295 [Polyangiaceae bacterium]